MISVFREHTACQGTQAYCQSNLVEVRLKDTTVHAVKMRMKNPSGSIGGDQGYTRLRLLKHMVFSGIGIRHSRKRLLFIVQSLSLVWLFATPWTAAQQASLSFTISQTLLKLMSIESVMPSNHLILCHPPLLLPSIFPSIRVFSSESALHIRWPIERDGEIES